MNFRNNKSPGNDGLTAEMSNYGGPDLLIQLQRLIEEIWSREKIHPEWTAATVFPFFKKGDKSECQSYRGISLLNVTYKVLAQCIKGRLLRNMESIVGEF